MSGARFTLAWPEFLLIQTRTHESLRAQKRNQIAHNPHCGLHADP